MPGAAQERPRAHRLTDIEPQTSKALGCNRMDEFRTPVGPGGNNMGSVARFPKLDECAHFHYEHVELGALEVSVSEGSSDSDTYTVRVTSGDACWSLQRSYDNFVMFDKQLHRCIFDRKFSSLVKLPDTRPKLHWQTIKEYVQRFSQLNHEGLNCGPVLNWLQLDNRGRRILVPESDSCPINTPAVAAAYAVRPYVAQAQDEISFQVGDMISVIDMPPPGESTWWRGKHGFAVGFFPAECVAVIGDKVPRHLTVSTTVRSKLPVKPVLRKHGKLIAFFRSFILNRPSRRRLKQSGILKERVFGCDLGEHLLNSGQDVPTVLTCCAEFIENHGLVDGIYRLSGVTSNIQRLRNAFDEDRVPALHSDESILQDIHSVASLLKMYFRELPNPLCTYQLYSTFVNAVQANTDAERIRRMRDTVRKLPPPHYRTLEYLMRHLVRVAARGAETGMTPRNVAIVWAPNLLRCKELEVGGVAALQGVGVQAVVTEFLVCYAELIFGDGPVGRPKSLAISTPARLLSLEEARNRNVRGDADYIDVGAGPAGLPLHYHTVIDLPRKRNGTKRSPSLNWRALFGRGALGARGKARQVGTPPQTETISSSLNSLRRLRPVKSADSLDGEDSLGPLLGPPAVRACGHSRSVSHDSYFDHLTDAPNATSPLDLSEIQLNFDLEEREMRMFSEEEGGGVASVEASPRRQRSESAQCPAATGGSKRKRSRLEERLHCDVELRFIDSQSPDQVMVSADVHNIDTPSPLTTPGYLPLLSESSTPLSPATLEGTSPQVANSPRISFRSFTLPLEIDGEQSNANNSDRVSMSSDKTSEISDRLSLNLNERQSINANAAKQSEEILVYDRQKDARDLAMNSSESRNRKVMEKAEDAQDEEMTPCERLLSPSPSEPTAASKVLSGEDKSLDDGEGTPKYIRKEQDTDRSTPEFQNEQTENEKQILDTADNEAPPLSTATDLDSPMSCEQTLEDLPDSGFVICDNSEKIFTNTDTQQQMLTTLTNDPSEWIIVERTSDSIVTPPSDGSCSPKDSLEGMTKPALMSELPCGRSETEENVSRTSLDFEGLSGTLETDTSCVGVNDLPDSPVHSRLSTDLIRAKDYKDLEDCSDDPTNNNGEIHSSDTHEQDNGNNTCCSGLDNDKCLENHRYTAQNTSQQRETQRSTRTYSRLSDYREKKGLKGIYELENANETSDNKCENFEESPKQEQQKQQSPSPRKYISNSETSGSPRRSSLRNLQMRRENVEAIILSENATQPREIAHTPEGAAELVVSFDSSCTFSNPPSPLDESVVLRDTAAILQELALQRLSGGMVAGESSISPKKRYDCDLSARERRSFDSEIGREIVRERKMRQELDSARGGKSEESPSVTLHQHLPPCLKARHSRAHRATLSRSLDEAKFNKITGESSLAVKQASEESQQHSSTPNVGAGSNSSSSSSSGSVEKVQARNLGGLDLGNPQCRERIERYKEERRTFLRDKYRSESFRSSGSKSEEDGAEALVARLKQRASRPSLH